MCYGSKVLTLIFFLSFNTFVYNSYWTTGLFVFKLSWHKYEIEEFRNFEFRSSEKPEDRVTAKVNDLIGRFKISFGLPALPGNFIFTNVYSTSSSQMDKIKYHNFTGIMYLHISVLSDSFDNLNWSNTHWFNGALRLLDRWFSKCPHVWQTYHLYAQWAYQLFKKVSVKRCTTIQTLDLNRKCNRS